MTPEVMSNGGPPSDKPTRIDAFGFEPYVKGVADVVRSIQWDDLPVAIGIYGAWGSGKTSFAQQLEDQLTAHPEQPVPSVWFNAWKYDRTNDVRSALIYAVLAKLQSESHGTAKDTVTKSIKKAIEASKRLALRTQICVTGPGASITLPALGELVDTPEKAAEFRTTADDLSDGFADAVQAYLQQEAKRKKLVIFVDDLDRCLPENVIVVLEAIKLFLDKAPCVFIIAVDRMVVEKAVQNHYGSDPGVSGRDYLDKIVQYPFTVPVPNTAKLREWMRALNPPDMDEKSAHVFDLASEGNPRTYFRLITSWTMVTALAPHVIPEFWRSGPKHSLAIAIALHLRWPVIRELAISNQLGFRVFAGFCLNPPSRQPVDDAFNHSAAVEYRPHWTNVSMRRFFRGIEGKVGKDMDQIFGANAQFQEALELCTRGG